MGPITFLDLLNRRPRVLSEGDLKRSAYTEINRLRGQGKQSDVKKA